MNTNNLKSSASHPAIPTATTDTPVASNKQATLGDDSATSRSKDLALDLDKLLTIASSRSSSRHSSPGRNGSPGAQLALAIKTRRPADGGVKATPAEGAGTTAGAYFDAEKGILGTSAGTYAVGRLLGEGSFGNIFQGINPLGYRVVIKVVDMEKDLARATTAQERAAVLRKHRGEFTAMRKADASCQPRDMAVVGTTLYIVMGQLRVHMEEEELRGAIAPDSRGHVANCMFHDICGELGRVHARGWLHRDVKLANFMLDNDGGIRLIDFGESMELAPGRMQLVTQDELCNADLFAPETLLHWENSEPFGERIDSRASEMFSLGLCWAMTATGRTTQPFENCLPAHEAWPAVHAGLPVDAATGLVDVEALAARPVGERREAILRDFVVAVCRADLRMGSYVALHVLHPEAKLRPSAERAGQHSALTQEDISVGRALLKKRLPCDAKVDAHVEELLLRHRSAVANA